MIFRVYRNSILASLFSGFGTCMIPIGIGVSLTEGHLPLGMAVAGAGLAMLLSAKPISASKRFKKYVNSLRANGAENRIRSSPEAAMQAYAGLPTKQTLNYIAALNPQAAEQIRASMAAERK